jgi:large subunit ribosomal protein L10
MPTPQKAEEIERLTEKLERMRAGVLLSTQGMSVAEMTALRRRLSDQSVELHVVKNTLLRIASERANYQNIEPLLHGQTTIAIGYDDEVAPAKVITEYLRTTRLAKPVTVKAGILERAPITPQQVEALAKTPSREQLHAQVVGAVMGPLNHTYSILTAPLRDLIYVLEARIQQMGGAEVGAQPGA